MIVNHKEGISFIADEFFLSSREVLFKKVLSGVEMVLSGGEINKSFFITDEESETIIRKLIKLYRVVLR